MKRDKKAGIKTNVMRLLDAAHIAYEPHIYAHTDAVSGVEVAAALGQDADAVYKTLVTVGKKGAYYVFMVPASGALSLKKAAQVVGEKSLEMLPQKHLYALTGYVHGGCSPLGMKKQFPTYVDASVAKRSTFCFSAGRIGYQVEMDPEALRRLLDFGIASLTE